MVPSELEEVLETEERRRSERCSGQPAAQLAQSEQEEILEKEERALHQLRQRRTGIAPERLVLLLLVVSTVALRRRLAARASSGGRTSTSANETDRLDEVIEL